MSTRVVATEEKEASCQVSSEYFAGFSRNTSTDLYSVGQKIKLINYN